MEWWSGGVVERWSDGVVEGGVVERWSDGVVEGGVVEDWRGGVVQRWRGGVVEGGGVEWGMGRDRTRIVVSSGCGLATRHRVVCTIGRLLPRPVRFLKYGSPTTDTMRRYPVRSTAEANQRPLLAERPLASCCCR